MSTSRKLACLMAAVGLMVATGDRLAPADAGALKSDARAGASGENLPRFPIFGWVSPPISETTSARFREMAEAGFNLALPAIDDTGGLADSRAQLDVAAANGMKVMLWDARFEDIALGLPDTRSRLDSVLAEYRDHPGLGAYYLGDEPPESLFDTLGAMNQALAEFDGVHPGWNNLLGRQSFLTLMQQENYTRGYIDRFGPAVLCNDHYEFTTSGDRNQFVVNVLLLNRLAREYGIPFWSIVLLTEHGDLRGLTDGELKWQVSHLLAYGARGVGYFTYWTPREDPRWNWQPAVIDTDGTRTHWYGLLAEFNPRVRAAGETLVDLTWLMTEHAGSVPNGGQAFVPDDWIAAVEGRAALGQFVDASDGRYLVVVNSDSSSTRTIGLELPGTRSVRRLGDRAGDWRFIEVTEVPDGQGDTNARVEVPLAAGDFALLQLSGDVAAGLAGGAVPQLLVMPNPASVTTTFSTAGALHGATLEILDAGGRRVWVRRLSGGSANVRWDGMFDSGERAPSGVYFTRLEDERGATVRRLVWLGR